MSPVLFFFTNITTPKIYTLSLHDALPISPITHRSGKGFGQATSASYFGAAARCARIVAMGQERPSETASAPRARIRTTVRDSHTMTVPFSVNVLRETQYLIGSTTVNTASH